MSTLREEISRVRREILNLGGEWDITWTLSQLRKEMDDLKLKNAPRFVRSVRGPKPIVRHYILYLRLDRVTMFDRDLLPGLCKVRITTVSPTSSRFPVSDESKFAFKPGLTVHRENAGFKIVVPLIVGSPCPKNQLKEWKVEFEILHRFPAAPIYGVVARGWTDPWTLAHAKSMDLPSPQVPPPYVDYTGQEINPFHLKPVAKIDFVDEKTQTVFNVHIWRSAVRAIIFSHRLIKKTKESKKSNLEKLERDIRLLNARNQGEKEIMQMDLMMRTIGVMNEFLVAGAAGKLGEPVSGTKSWLASWLPAGGSSSQPTAAAPAPATSVDLSGIERQIADLRALVEEVRRGVGKVDEGKIPFIEKIEKTAPKSVADLVATRRESVSRGTVLTRGLHAHAPDTSAPPSRTESMISTPAETTEPAQSAPETPEAAGVIAEGWSSAMNAFWGATAAPAVETVKPPKRTIKKPVAKEAPPVEAAEPVVKPVGKSPVSKKPGMMKIVSPSQASPPKLSPIGKKSIAKKVIVAKPKAPQDPAKAKAELIVKLKILEAKRKAEVEKREAELVSFSKKVPPIDRYKFPGMPGPPPFKPKKPEPDPTSLLPSALAGDGEEEEGDEEEEE